MPKVPEKLLKRSLKAPWNTLVHENTKKMEPTENTNILYVFYTSVHRILVRFPFSNLTEINLGTDAAHLVAQTIKN
jgi:hypothetical protein